MKLLLRVLGHLPRSWIQTASRAQWLHPVFKRAFDGIASRLRNQSGEIQQGVGRGLRFNPGAANAGYLLGTSEPHVQRALEALVRPGMVVLDVGANVGFLSVIATRLTGEAGRVIAFEPLPGNAQQIAHNAGLNGFENLEVVEAALSSTDGSATFAVSEESTWGRLSDARGVARPAGEIAVRVARLDTLLDTGEIPVPQLLKIDVEGAEADVIEGGKKLLREHRPLLLVELHGTNAAVEALLASLDYHAVVLGRHESIGASPWDAYVAAVPRERTELHPVLARLREP